MRHGGRPCQGCRTRLITPSTNSITMRRLLIMWLAVLVVTDGVAAEPGRWDRHRRRKHRPPPPATPRPTRPPEPPRRHSKLPAAPTTALVPTTAKPAKQWTHTLTSQPPVHRCQAFPHAPLPHGLRVNEDYVKGVESLLIQDKLLLSPIVFQGAMVSRTNTYKGLYFVSFKVIKVVKGRLHPQLNGHVRLLFQTEQFSSSNRRAGGGGGRRQLKGNACPPVPFNVRSGRKYLIFVKKEWVQFQST